MTDPERSEQASVRRAPKITVFLVLGGGLGAIVTLVLTTLFPVDPSVGFGPLFGYFALFGVPAGIVLGAVVALILDRASRRTVRTVTVEREGFGREAEFDDPAEPDASGSPDES